MSIEANFYNRAYAVGYFYGRAYSGTNVQVSYTTEDLPLINTKPFMDGMIAGVKDFEEIDLPVYAMEAPQRNEFGFPIV